MPDPAFREDTGLGLCLLSKIVTYNVKPESRAPRTGIQRCPVTGMAAAGLVVAGECVAGVVWRRDR